MSSLLRRPSGAEAAWQGQALKLDRRRWPIAVRASVKAQECIASSELVKVDLGASGSDGLLSARRKGAVGLKTSEPETHKYHASALLRFRRAGSREEQRSELEDSPEARSLSVVTESSHRPHPHLTSSRQHTTSMVSCSLQRSEPTRALLEASRAPADAFSPSAPQ